MLKIAGFMSGSGSVLENIIKKAINYRISVIFTDRKESNAISLAQKYGIPIIVKDIRDFYNFYNKPLKDKNIRRIYDNAVVSELKAFEIDLIVFAGYMSISTNNLLNAYTCLNVHPSDLTILDSKNKRKYVGKHAIREAILNKEKYLRSTVHLVNEEVDGGSILKLSDKLYVNYSVSDNLEYLVKYYQNILKKIGDYVIFPEVLNNWKRYRGTNF